METTMKIRTSLLVTSLAAALAWTSPAFAHCDTLDGPVISAARTALEQGKVNLVLVWVQKTDEPEIRRAFEQARAVRKAGGEAKALADMHFFETLVRVHRAGEGAPYTGLKPAGTVEPPVAAADQAIADGRVQDVAKLVSDRMHDGLHQRYEAVASKKHYDPDDVAAGRAFTGAYVQYVHYVERLYDAAGTAEAAHAGQAAHGASADHAAPAPQHAPAAHAH
jgi:hypothetical protein